MLFAEQSLAARIPGLSLHDTADTPTGQAPKIHDFHIVRPTVMSRHRLSERMLRQRFQSGQYRCSFPPSLRPNLVRHDRPPLGNGTGFVEHDGIDPPGGLQTIGIFYQDTLAGRLAYPYRYGVRRGESQRTRTGDNQDGHQRENTVRETVGGVEEHPKNECQQGNSHDGRYEDRGNPVHKFLHGGLTALCILHHADDLGEQRIAAYLLGTKGKAPFLVDGAGEDPIALPFPDSHRFARQHALVHVGGAARHAAVHGYPFARLHEQDIARTHLRNTRLPMAAVRRHERHRPGLEPHQFADGRSRTPLRTLFQQPAQ